MLYIKINIYKVEKCNEILFYQKRSFYAADGVDDGGGGGGNDFRRGGDGFSS